MLQFYNVLKVKGIYVLDGENYNYFSNYNVLV